MDQLFPNSRDAVFGINVGCGVNREAYAFAYGKYAKEKEALGCGVIFNTQSAIFVPMGKELKTPKQNASVFLLLKFKGNICYTCKEL